MSPVVDQEPQRRIYADAFAKWPKQDLQPDFQLQDILSEAVQNRYKTIKPELETEELMKARALQFLVQNKYNDRVRASPINLMQKLLGNLRYNATHSSNFEGQC